MSAPWKEILSASPPTLTTLGGLALTIVAAAPSLQTDTVWLGATPGPVERLVIGAVGLALVAVGVVLFVIRTRWHGSRKNVLAHPEFWQALWDVLPPAFVKRDTLDVRDVHKHLLENKALELFQGPKDTSYLPKDIRDRIASDHNQGDRKCLEDGVSWQLEFCDPRGASQPVQVLTMKYRVEYMKRRYIVGLVIPVVATIKPGERQVDVRVWKNLPLLAPLTHGGGETLPVPVSESWQAAVAARASSGAAG